jgi:hypothetical protein
VLQIGDCDPSGVHVFSHLAEDVAAFAAAYQGDVEFVRLAVTLEQAHELALESTPPKATDRRAFAADETYQAEAIDPADLAQIVENAITARLDQPAYDAVLRAEIAARKTLLSRLDLECAPANPVVAGCGCAHIAAIAASTWLRPAIGTCCATRSGRHRSRAIGRRPVPAVHRGAPRPPAAIRRFRADRRGHPGLLARSRPHAATGLAAGAASITHCKRKGSECNDRHRADPSGGALARRL